MLIKLAVSFGKDGRVESRKEWGPFSEESMEKIAIALASRPGVLEVTVLPAKEKKE